MRINPLGLLLESVCLVTVAADPTASAGSVAALPLGTFRPYHNLPPTLFPTRASLVLHLTVSAFVSSSGDTVIIRIVSASRGSP